MTSKFGTLFLTVETSHKVSDTLQLTIVLETSLEKTQIKFGFSPAYSYLCNCILENLYHSVPVPMTNLKMNYVASQQKFSAKNIISCIFCPKIWKLRKIFLSLQQIIKLRHSFLNGHGRPRTAFLLCRHR